MPYMGAQKTSPLQGAWSLHPALCARMHWTCGEIDKLKVTNWKSHTNIIKHHQTSHSSKMLKDAKDSEERRQRCLLCLIRSTSPGSKGSWPYTCADVASHRFCMAGDLLLFSGSGEVQISSQQRSQTTLNTFQKKESKINALIFSILLTDTSTKRGGSCWANRNLVMILRFKKMASETSISFYIYRQTCVHYMWFHIYWFIDSQMFCMCCPPSTVFDERFPSTNAPLHGRHRRRICLCSRHSHQGETSKAKENVAKLPSAEAQWQKFVQKYRYDHLGPISR